MPSPTSETLMPSQSSRKSRDLRGRSRPTRETPPGRSSPSKLCCIGLEQHGVRPLGPEKVLVERIGRHRTAEEVSLPEIEAKVLQRVDLVLVLDPFRDDLEPEPIADRHDRRGQSVVVDA